MESLFLGIQNLGGYLCSSRNWFPCLMTLKKLLRQLIEINQTTTTCCTSCFDDQQQQSRWQRLLHEDIMTMIVRPLNLRDRIRLGSTCKSWNSVCMRGDIRGCAEEAPWLLLPQDPNRDYLCFSSVAEGKVHKVRLPRPLQGCWFYGSSRGWLVMIKDNGLKSNMFLFNPISRSYCRLPPLVTIPSFKRFVKTNFDLSGAVHSFYHIVLSTSDINSSECMVAAIFDSLKVLVMCKLGDKSWTVVQLLGDEDGIHAQLLFSSSGKLYALIKADTKHGLIQPRTVKLGDQKVELISVYDNGDRSEVDIEYHKYFKINLRGQYTFFLLESINNEVLIVHGIDDVFNKLSDDEEDGEEDDADSEYCRTRGFNVYKIDPKTGAFQKVQNLGDQTLFLTRCGSFSLRTSEFNKQLQRNCIHFAANATPQPYVRKPFTSREIGIFYLDNERVERSFPSVEISMRSEMSWFTPSLG